MTVLYCLDEEDYVTFQLFIASKSRRIKRNRFLSKIIVPFVFLVMCLVVFEEDNLYSVTVFFIFALLWFFFYPYREKHRYIKHYTAFVNENYKGRLGRTITFDLSVDHIVAKDIGNESKIQITEINEINEIDNYIFINLKSGSYLILPKTKIKEIELLSAKLKELAITLNIKYLTDLAWKWK